MKSSTSRHGLNRHLIFQKCCGNKIKNPINVCNNTFRLEIQLFGDDLDYPERK